eukprot:gene12107-13236_t
MSCSIHYLNDDLYLYIASFLFPEDQISFGSCCMHFYQNLLQKQFRTIYIRSPQFYQRYHNDEKYRQQFHQIIKYPDRQLSINGLKFDNFEDFSFDEVDYIECDLDIFVKDYNQKLTKINRLWITTTDSSSIDANEASSLLVLDSYRLKNLKIVNWNEEEELTLPSLPLTIEHFHLEGSFSNLTDNTFQRLSNLQSLELSIIESLTDVSWFSKIRKLSIDECPNVTDITPLQDNYEISIKSCHGILDYRHSLTNSQIITIIDPIQSAIIDIHHFKNMRKLRLLSKNCYSFTLPQKLTKLEYGGGLENIMINDSYMIEMSNEELVLRGNMKEEELFFGNFGGVKRLDIRNIFFHTADVQRIQSLKGLEKLRNLERFAISNNCIECESIGWKMLKENFYQFRKKNHSFYLRKIQNK